MSCHSSRSSSPRRMGRRSRIARAARYTAGSPLTVPLCPAQPDLSRRRSVLPPAVLRAGARPGGHFLFVCKPASHPSFRITSPASRWRASPFAGQTRPASGRPIGIAGHRGSPARHQGRPGGQLVALRSRRRRRAHLPQQLHHRSAGAGRTTSPNSPSAAAPDGRSRTRPSTCSRPAVTTSSTASAMESRTWRLSGQSQFAGLRLPHGVRLADGCMAPGQSERRVRARVLRPSRGDHRMYLIFSPWDELLQTLAFASLRHDHPEPLTAQPAPHKPRQHAKITIGPHANAKMRIAAEATSRRSWTTVGIASRLITV